MPEANMRRLVCFFLLFSLIELGYSIDPIVIELLYYEPCSTCPKLQEQYEIYVHNSQLIDDIENDYGSKVSVKRIEFFSEEGLEKAEHYGIGIKDYNTIVINCEKVIPAGYVNETYVREIVDSYLHGTVHDIAILKVTLSRTVVEIGGKVNITVTVKNVGIETESFNVNTYCNESLIGTQPVTDLTPNHEFSLIFVCDTMNQTYGKYVIKTEAEPVMNEINLLNNVYIYDAIEVTGSYFASFIATLVLAFSFGFFETFSPCLIILLSFLLSYTIGNTRHFKGSFLKVMIFGAGFISATLLLAVAFGLVFLSTPVFQYSFTWLICVFAVVFGLHLIGVLKIPSKKIPFQSKPLVRKLAKKYVITHTGIFLLGFVFYFLDPCIAPIFISMMPLLLPETLAFTLFVFCLGAIIPFVGVGIFAGSVSKLARSTYRHRSKIRAISGLVLINYALYLIIFQLIPKLIS